MPRQTKNVEHALSERTLVLDNGAYTMKAGFATQDPNPETDCRVIPNCLAKSRDNRIWTGNQLGNCNDFGDMVFRRPVQKGYLVNWEAEREIWDNTFFDKTAILKVSIYTPLVISKGLIWRYCSVTPTKQIFS